MADAQETEPESEPDARLESENGMSDVVLVGSSDQK